MKLLLIALAMSAVSALQYNPSCDKPLYCNSKLLHYVQMARIFPDSKTFVDLHMKYDEKTIMNDFDLLLNQTNDQPSKQQIQAFVNANFESLNELESWTPSDFVSEPSFLANIKDIELRQFAKNIHNIWPILGRKVKPIVLEKPEYFSMIPVQNGFIVPGTRHNELYYWDTYWIIEGLLVSGMKDTVKGILSNLVDLQRTFGHIPNGNRWYFQQRSQPPLLIAMVMKYVEATHDVEFIKANIDSFESELQYWIDTQSVIFKKDGKEHTLLRYYAPSEGPRPEWYYEDYIQAQNFESKERQQQYFNDIKSAAESGWDISSRWFINQNGTNIGNLTSTHPSDIVPVDLNSIITNAMQDMAYFYSLMHNSRKGAHWAHIAKQYRSSIKEVMWNDEDGIWYDWDLLNDCQRKYFYPSNIAPLWMDVVDKEFMKEHAQPIIEYMKKTHSLEFPGGIPTSFSRTGEKWDYPYAWAPLVSMVVKSLEALKTEESDKLAFDVVKNWVRSNLVGYTTYKQLFDKYNVEAPGKVGEEEEYAVQAGFGWTNGATLEMLAKYGNILKAQDGYYNFQTYKSNPIFWHIPTSAYLPSYYKSSKTAPVITDNSPFNNFVYTSSSTYGDKPAVVSSVSSEHTDVSVSGKPESIAIVPSIPVKPQLIPSAPIMPEYIPSAQVRPELIPSTPIKPELVPTVPVKPEIVPVKPVPQEQILSDISYSENAQSVHPPKPVQVSSTYQNDAHISATPEIIPLKASVGSFVSETSQSSYTGSAFSESSQTPLKPTEFGIATYTPSQSSYNGSAISTAEYVGSDSYAASAGQIASDVSKVEQFSSTFITQQKEGAAYTPAGQAEPGLYQIQQDVPAIPQSENIETFGTAHYQFEQNDSPQTGFSVGEKPVQTENVSPILTQSGNFALPGSGFPGAVLNTTSNFASGQAQFEQSAAPQTSFSIGYKPVQTEKPSSALTQSGNVGGALSGSGFPGALINTTSNFSSGQVQYEQSAAPQTGFSIGYKPLQTETVSPALTQSENIGGALSGSGFPVRNTASNFASGQTQFEQSASSQTGFSIGYKPVQTENVSPALTQSGNVGGAISGSGFPAAVLNTASNFASEQAQLEQSAAPQTGFSVGYKPVQSEKVSPALTQSGNVGGAFSGSGFPGAVLNTASNFASGQAQFEQSASPQTGFSVGYKPVQDEKVSPAPTQSGNVGGTLSGSGFSGAVFNTASNFASEQAHFEQSAAPQTGFSVGYKPVQNEKVSPALTQSGNVGGVLSGSGFPGAVLNTASNFASGQAQFEQNAAPQTGFSVGYKPVQNEKVSPALTQSGNVGGALSGSGFPGAVLNTASNFAPGQAQFEQNAAPQTGFSVGYKPVQTEKPSPALTQSGNVGGALSGSGFPGAVLNTASNFASGQAHFEQSAAPQTGFSVGYKPVQNEKVSPALTQSGNVGGVLSGSGFPGAVLNTASNFASGQAQFEQNAAPQTGFSVGYKPVQNEKVSPALTQSGNVGGVLSGSGFPGAVLNTASNFASGQAQFEQNAAPQTGFSVGYKPVQNEKVSPALTQSGNVGGALSGSGFPGAVLNTASNFAPGQAQFEQNAAPQTGFSVGYKPVQTEKPSPALTQSGNVGGALSGSGFPGAVLNTASNFASGQAHFEQSAAPQTGFSVGYKPVQTEKPSPALTQSGNVGGALSGSGFPGAVLNTASNFASGQAHFEQSAAPQTGFSVGYKPVQNEKVSPALTQSGNVGGVLSGSGFPGAVLNTASNFASGQAHFEQSAAPQTGFSVGYKPVQNEKVSPALTQSGNVGGVLSGSGFPGAVLNTASNFASGQAQFEQNAAPQTGFSVGYKPVQNEKVSPALTQSGNVGGALSGSGFPGAVLNTASNFAPGQAQFEQNAAPQTGFSVGYKPVQTEKPSPALTQSGNVGGALSGSGFPGAVLNTASNFASGQAHFEQSAAPQTGFSVGYKPVQTEKPSPALTQSGNVGGALSGSGFPGAVLNTASNFASGQAHFEQSAAPQTGFSVGYKPVQNEKVSPALTQSGNVGGVLSGSGFPGAVLNTASNFVSGQAQLGQSAFPQAGFSYGNKPVQKGRTGLLSALSG